MIFKKISQPEWRFDPINKDWVVVAPGRGKRPEDFKKKEPVKEESQEKVSCVFCDYFILPKFADKNFAVVPNKFPAFSPGRKPVIKTENNFFQTAPSSGFHEVVVFKDHSKQLSDLDFSEWEELFGVYQNRYIELAKENFVNYISIFHNHGKLAGASLAHPHSQIAAISFFDKDISIAVDSAKRFFKEKSQCLFCSANRAERSAKKRIVFENGNFLAVCPFASRTNFEVIISPKNHLPRFEEITKEEKKDLAVVFQTVLAKISKGLNYPDYNFYLKTSPCDQRNYSFFHWHFAIMPRISVWAGFEMGSGIEIITMPPEKSAEYLRNVRI